MIDKQKHMFSSLWTIWVILILSATSSAATWYVDKDNNSGTENGAAWATAFTTIQAGVDAAFADGGGEVWVAEGVYDEQRMSMMHDPPVDTGSLVMKEGVHIYGGFVGTESARDARDSETHVTIIDGSTARNGEPAYHVVVGADDATIDAFMITGGNANGSSTWTDLCNTGGGMYNFNCSPMVTNCTFSGNSSYYDGSGMYNRFCPSPTITNCTFSWNSANASAGGVYNYSSSSLVTNCTFTDNSAEYFAGGMYNYDSSQTISNCTFLGNSSHGFGGAGMYNDRCSATVINCVFTGNSGSYGGGMNNDRCSATVINCVFTGNSGSYGGGMNNYRSSVTVTNCILWGDSPQEIYNDATSETIITYCDVQGGYGGEGNIDLDPLFFDTDSEDYRLRAASPCIDAGTSTGAPATDILGVSRPQGAGFDIGAYEYEYLTPPAEGTPSAGIVALALVSVSCAVTGATVLRRKEG